MDETQTSFSEDFSQLESVGVSNDCFSTALLNCFVCLLFTFRKSLVNIRLYKRVQLVIDTRYSQCYRVAHLSLYPDNVLLILYTL